MKRVEDSWRSVSEVISSPVALVDTVLNEGVKLTLNRWYLPV